MTDKDYIKNFTKIKVSSICNRMKIDKSNIISGKASPEKMKIIRAEIESEIARLYIKNTEGDEE